MTDDPLSRKIRITQHVLVHRFESARTHPVTLDRPRDRYAAIDPFIASCSQHLLGALEVLVPEARKSTEEGGADVHEFIHQLRELEKTLNWVKARAYGSAYLLRKPWSEIWDAVESSFVATMRAERAMVDDLAETLDQQQSVRLAERLLRAEHRAPTRPHPFVSHHGPAGVAARRLCRVVDRFWDQAEGRMIPEPVSHHHREHEGLLTQYLLADPHWSEQSAAEPGRSA